MTPQIDLFLSPHPDDLVYSAFAEIIERRNKRAAVVFFNASRFTRWGILPKNLVTIMRTIEEVLILSSLGLRTSFLWLEDSSTRSAEVDKDEVAFSLDKFRGRVRSLFCPLALTGHPDHVMVRNVAVDYWLRCRNRPRISFYEDLPYAARIDGVDNQVEGCVKRLSKVCADLSVRYKPLSVDLFRRKLFFSRLYLTQNDQTRLLEKHGKELGQRCGSSYAEKYVCTPEQECLH